MEISWVKKIVVCGIILLFVEAGVIQSFGINVIKSHGSPFDQGNVKFRSREYSSSPNRPHLEISYTGSTSPVILEPIKDTYLDRLYPDTPMGSSDTLQIGYSSGNLDQITLIKFDLSSLQPGYTIESGMLKLFVYDVVSTVEIQCLKLAYPFGYFNEDDTWNGAQGHLQCDSTPVTTITVDIGNEGWWIYLDVTAHVDYWYNHPAGYNEGFYMKHNINPGPQNPVAEAGGPYTGDVGENILFDASGSYDPDGSIVGYRWDWTSDGTWDTGWLSTPTTTHSYATAGPYTAKLQVKDNDDLTAEDTAEVQVGSNPVAYFDWTPINPLPNQIITFDASASYDPDGTVVGYRWDWTDDGVWDTVWLSSPTIQHSFATSGTYIVNLQVKDNDGLTDEYSAEVEVKEPTIDLKILSIEFNPISPMEGQPTTITAYIQNNGNADANGVHLQFYTNTVIYGRNSQRYPPQGDLPWREYLADFDDNGIINKGTTKPISITWIATQIYNFEDINNAIIVGVDPLGTTDANPADNILGCAAPYIQFSSHFSSYPNGFSFQNSGSLFSQNDFPSKEELKQPVKDALIKGGMISCLAGWWADKILDLLYDPNIYLSGAYCYGMSSTSQMYYRIPELKPHDVSKLDTFLMFKGEVKADIIRYQKFQIIGNILDLLRDQDYDAHPADNYDLNADLIKGYTKDHIPVVLDLWNQLWYRLLQKIAGRPPITEGAHTVIAQNILFVGNQRYATIYDPNAPGRVRNVSFDLDSTQFTYDYDGNKYSRCGVALPIEEIDREIGIMVKKFTDSLVDYFKNKLSKIIFIKCPVNVTIKDQFGRIIDDSGIEEIPNASYAYLTNDSKMFVLPRYINCNISLNAYDNGIVNMTQMLSLDEDNYSITGFTNVSVNKNTNISINLTSNATSYTMDIDMNGDGIIDETLYNDLNESIDKSLPIADFIYYSTDILTNQNISFNASSSYVYPNRTATYEWNFDDGTHGTGMVVNHSYNIPGLFTVNLTITDNASKTGYYNNTLRVFPKYVWTDDDFTSSTPGWNITHFKTIQQSIDAVGKTGIVYIHNGTYNEHVIVNKTVHLLGENRNTTIIDGNGIGDGIHVSADNVEINGFTIRNSGSSHDENFYNCDAGIDLRSNTSNITNNIISHSLIGILIHNSSHNNIIERNWIMNHSGRGILFLASTSNNYVYLNNFVNNTQHAYDTSNNNTWYNGELQQGNYWDDSNVVDSDGNGIGDGPYWLYVDSYDEYPLMYPWYPNHPDMVYIDDNYSITTHGFGYDHFNMIQHGINEVTGNPVVFVSSGEYNGCVTITKSMQLIGENRNTTMIHSGLGINIIASNVYVSNFSIDGTQNEGPYCGIYTTSSYTIINNCTITSFNTYGIYLGFTDNNNISNCVISNCPSGITLWVCYSSIISNCSISNCNQGIYIFWNGSNNNIIRNCTISVNEYGIYAYGSWNNLIYHNNFISNTYNAYESWGNTWDNGYPSGGNYWDDYTGTDTCHGLNQDIPGSDGIGDSQYPVYVGNKKDKYPLMGPWINIQHPPNIPNTPIPANGTTNVQLDADLSWFCSDLDEDPLTYDVYFGITNPPPQTMENQSSQTYNPGTMNPNTIYFWKIVAWDTHGASTAGSLWTFTTKVNNPPVFGTPNPTNGSTGKPISFTWSIPINDPEGDHFNWTIQCNNGQSAGANGASNGTKSLSLSELAYSTTYKVWVNATDSTESGIYTRKWYIFTTKISLPPVFGTSSPANGSINNTLSFTWTIPINDPEGDTFSWSIQCSNGQANNGTGATNGTKTLGLSGLAYSTTYKVWVNATDPTGSGLYTRKWFTFTTQQQQNSPPNKPSKPSGQTSGKIKTQYTYTSSTTDPDDDQVYYQWDWGDGTQSNWLGPCNSGDLANASHTWKTKNTFNIKVKAKDTAGAESPWSDPLSVTMPFSYHITLLHLLQSLFERFPNAFPILRYFLGY